MMQPANFYVIHTPLCILCGGDTLQEMSKWLNKQPCLQFKAAQLKRGKKRQHIGDIKQYFLKGLTMFRINNGILI